MNATTTSDAGTVRLWTFQKAEIVPSLLAGRVHRVDWQHTPQNWRLAYKWMADRLAAAVSGCGPEAPVWCWHSCDGRFGSPPTVGTACSLFGDFELQHEDLIALELTVPVKLSLLSSYNHWNEFMDYVLARGRVPRNSKYARSMFKEPLLKHSMDNIQAVIPFIKPAWVQRIEKLVVEGRDWDEPLLADRERELAGADP